MIPFTIPSIGKEEIDAVTLSLRSKSLTNGSKTSQFEEEFCRVVGSRYAVAVNSSTVGIHLALAALGIGFDDEVITSPLTFSQTINAILLTGARPVLADVGRDGNLDPSAIARRINRRTRAIIPVHLAGASCDMDAIWEIARSRKLHVIEDATHALGSGYKNRHVGSSYGVANSDAVVFSFGASNDVTAGEGGMVVTALESVAQRMRTLTRQHPGNDAMIAAFETSRHIAPEGGFPYTLSEIQSAIGIQQLRKLATFQAERQSLAQQYNREFADVPAMDLPLQSAHGSHAWHLYMIRLRLDLLEIDRAEFISQLRERNIDSNLRYVPAPGHRASPLLSADERCPRSLEIYQRLVALPLYPGLQPTHLRRVIDSVKEILMRNRITARMYLKSSSAG